MIPKVDMAVDIISSRLENEENLEELLNNYVDPTGKGPLTNEEKEETRIKINKIIAFNQAYNSHEIEDPAIISDPEGHEPWYDEWISNNSEGRYYWSAHLECLTKNSLSVYPDDPRKEALFVSSINNSSDKILQLMESPQRREFKTKGLVVGYVQSGKTANYTAVIAKAVDAGYRLVIVLTGIHNNLRSQTQERLDKELTGESRDPSVQRSDLEYRRWKRLTNISNDFDNTNLNQDSFESYIDCRNPIIGIMKKNTIVLDRFIQWIENASPEKLSTIPLLLIDDEADQASINTKNRKEEDPSTTNKSIRNILSKFPRHAYIGYTATPFANVLTDMAENHDGLGRDLYPRNFIVSLPKPDGYIGATDIFGNDKSHIYIREVPDEEAKKYSKNSLIRVPTPSLEEAILCFYLSCAARYKREDSEKPMTMLIHTTHRQAGHGVLKNLVEEYCSATKANWKYDKSKLIGQFALLWEKIFLDDINKNSTEGVYPFEDIEPYLDQILDDTLVFELNSASDDKLDYSQHKDIKVIAIGGNKLSRGLTLEGLLTSFYLRESNQYDTLLQMGRWFGYRRGYEDLTRIYTTKALRSKFEDLSFVEEELRQEIYRYEDENCTPVEVSVRIRSHSEMKVTARNKMGSGQITQGSYSGRLCQNIWFLLDKPEILKNNLDIGEKFISKYKKWIENDGSHVFKNVPCSDILEFLKSYTFAKKDDISGLSSLDSEDMIKYIERVHKSGELQYWNVGIIGLKKKPANGKNKITWGPVDIIPVERSRVKDTKYKVGVTSSPSDLNLDSPKRIKVGKKRKYKARHVSQNPLLLLYRISKGSKPMEEGSKSRVALFEGLDDKVDVLGLVIEFPESKVVPYDHIAQIVRSD